MKFVLEGALKQQALNSAHHIADWLINNQTPQVDYLVEAGCVYEEDYCGHKYPASNWQLAFASMGLCAAAKAFDDERYAQAADHIINYLRGFQIFSPFIPQHYGAIRELSHQTPWCWTRDALSAAWGFLEYYRYTNNPEFLERARLWGEWFLKNGLDETGWPYWGVQFGPYWGTPPHMCNDMHGCFHGGSLNFFYQLAKTTGDQKWVGDFYKHMADYFVDTIQQQDGYFRTVDKVTGKVPEHDPQNGLHRGNDDLGTLGLLGAYRLSGDKRYLRGIEKFLHAVFERQLPDGHFEKSCAAIPVILNIYHEIGDDSDFQPPAGAVEKALQALFSRQFPQNDPLYHRGGLNEMQEDFSCLRSSNYALIALLKLAGCDVPYLCC